MESRLRIAGHSIHPLLVMFPLGLFAMAVVFDLAHVLGGPAMLGEVAYWNLAAGLVGGVVAALAGAVDLTAVPHGTPARRAAVLHALANMAVLLLFTVILMVRMGAGARTAGGGLLLVELLAFGCACVGAWWGTERAGRLRSTALPRAAAGQRTT